MSTADISSAVVSGELRGISPVESGLLAGEDLVDQPIYQNTGRDQNRAGIKRIKKISFCSEGDSFLPPSSYCNVDVVPDQFHDVTKPAQSRPEVPGKKCARSISQISRLSAQSDSSSRSEHSVKYSYDEVSLSSNFGKRVIVTEPNSPKVDDIFKSVSFTSPLKDVIPGISNQTLMEDQIYQSFAASQGQFLNCHNDEENENYDDPYEDIEEIRRSLADSDKCVQQAPEPPPRNSILKPDNLYENHETLATENIYSDCDTSGDSVKKLDVECVKNLMDEDIENSDDESTGDETYSTVTELGARPKTGQSSRMTIDIRSVVSQWYEEAEKEVERDLSLDISQLEGITGQKKKKIKPAYEHISLAITGHPVMDGGEILPQPTMTLLRDFDPCFDEDEESQQVYDDEVDQSYKIASNAIYNQISKTDEEEAVVKTNDKVMPPTAKPRSKFPKGANKKIFFGPPKPPRSFNYSPLGIVSEDREPGKSKTKKNNFENKDNIEHVKPVKSDKLKILKSHFSDKILTKGARASDSKENLEAMENPKDELKDDLKSEEVSRIENIYVTLPLNKEDSSSSPEESPRPPSTSPPPLPSTLPPGGNKGKTTMYENVWVEGESISLQLPPVPPRHRPQTPTCKINIIQTPAIQITHMTASDKLTNIQITSSDGLSSDSVISEVISGDKNSQESLTGRTRYRKNSQESLTCHSTSRHRKSESIDSESSSCYSLTSESPTPAVSVTNCDKLSHNSSENLQNVSSSPKKSRLKKFPSTRSFTVGNLAPKLNKLPELASSIRRRMSDQLKPMGNFGKIDPKDPTVKTSSIFLETPDVSDTDTDIHIDDEVITKVKRNSFMSDHLKPGTKNQTGALYVWSRGKKFQCKWCVLGYGSLQWYNEETSLAIPKETILLSNIFSITKRVDKQQGPREQELLCFEISALNSKGKLSIYLLGSPSSHERDTWMERLAQSLSNRLNNFDISQINRLGWAFVKLGFAAEWSLSWLSLTNRHLCYTIHDVTDSMETIDLKKTKDMFIRNDSKNLCLPEGFTKHPVLVCDFNDRSLYILLGAEKECKSWKSHIEQIAFNNSNVLKEQQVTHEDIPVIVDKCVKFVYSHGVMTEGIYRLAGGNTKINKLLSEFRSNAWTVQISRDDYSEHDVANVLKRFIRQLSEPLLTEYLREMFLSTARLEDQGEKLDKYRELLTKLPTTNYNTLRRLVGHLHIVADQCDKNLMSVYNLASLWGPNMMTVDGQEATQFAQTNGEMEVCADLITNYPWLFNVDNIEVEKERRMLEVLEKINFPTPSSLKRSGDIRMWVYILSRTSGDCISLVLHPSLTAGEALHRVGHEAGLLPDQLDQMFLHEVVLGGDLERPLHHSERLLDVTLRWGNWEETDRHDNYLLIKSNQFYIESLPCAVPPLSVFAELQFSDNKPGKPKFCQFLFSVSKANITYYKEDKTGIPTELAAWPVEEINWYLGAEQKRRAPHNLNITFISKYPGEGEMRSKESPLFGRVMSFPSRELFIKWIAALLVAEYPTDLSPPPTLVMLN